MEAFAFMANGERTVAPPLSTIHRARAMRPSLDMPCPVIVENFVMMAAGIVRWLTDAEVRFRAYY